MKKLRGFDVRAAKQFLLLNVEKIVFGVSMFLVALFCYGAISQEPYAKTPDQLRQTIASAQQNMQKIEEIPPKDVPEDPKFKEVARRATENVPPTGFALRPFGINEHLHIGTKRGEPELLAVTNLEANGGAGPFAMKNPDRTQRLVAQSGTGVTEDYGALPGPPGRPGARPTMPGDQPTPPAGTRRPGRPGSLIDRFAPQEDSIAEPEMDMTPMGLTETALRGVQAPPDAVVEAARWVCVTGLVPYREQLKRYTAEFSTAQHQDPTKDVPYWLGPLVERADVTSDMKDPVKANDPTKWKWEQLPIIDSQNFSLRWAVRASEVVDPGYTDENLTFPLGPLLERNWDKRVAHSKIPVLDPAQRGMTGDTGMAMEEPESASIAEIAQRAEGNDLDYLLNRRNKRTLMNPTGEGMMPGTRTIAPRTMARSMPGEGSGYSPRMAMGYDEGEGGYATTGEGTQEVEHLLFRFFDFSVEEGKQYSYRVQLVLENPNYGIRPQYLKDAKFREQPFRRSPVSEPSPVASVPTYNDLLAGPVEPAKTVALEPEVNLITVQLDPKMGTQAAYELRKPRVREPKRAMGPVPRGQLIKFTAKVDVVHPITRIPTEETVEFDAKRVVVDMRGGERFDPVPFSKDRDTLPGEVLFMDANGFLEARSEAADEADYWAKADWLFMLEEAKKAGSQAPVGEFLDEGGEGSFPTFPGRRGSGS